MPILSSTSCVAILCPFVFFIICTVYGWVSCKWNTKNIPFALRVIPLNSRASGTSAKFVFLVYTLYGHVGIYIAKGHCHHFVYHFVIYFRMTNKHFGWSYFHLQLYGHVVICNVYCIHCVEYFKCDHYFSTNSGRKLQPVCLTLI